MQLEPVALGGVGDDDAVAGQLLHAKEVLRPCGFLMPQTFSRSASSAISSSGERVAGIGRVEEEHRQ